MASKPTKNKHLGHRKRVKDRFMKHGIGYMEDYEILELLLFLVTPRQDTKPEAKEIIAKFGSFTEFVNASEEQFVQNNTRHNVTLLAKVIKEAVNRCMKWDFKKGNVISNWQSLVNYCRQRYGMSTVEQFVIIFLNTKNAVIDDYIFSTGTIDQTAVYTRELVKKAIAFSAASVILVHNHPSGDTAPSQSDILLTQEIIKGMQSVDITVYDHIIVSKSKGCFSFRRNGLL